jgi:outer membrane biosynthesis protein TonB
MIAMIEPLFGAGDGWGQLIVLIVFLVIGGINQIIKAIREKQPPAPPQRQRPLGGDAQRHIETELEAFLRRAQGGQQPPQPPTPPQPTYQAPRPTPTTPPAQKKKKQRKNQQAANQPVSAEVVDSSVQRRRLEPRLQQHIDTSRFDERAKHLTNIEQEADDIKSHMHKVFDHQLGSLGERTHVESDQAAGASEGQGSTPTAAVISAMLANPGSLQQAIIMQEILSRPVHRW